MSGQGFCDMGTLGNSCLSLYVHKMHYEKYVVFKHVWMYICMKTLYIMTWRLKTVLIGSDGLSANNQGYESFYKI